MRESSLLAPDPPPGVARGLSTVILASFALALVLAVTVKLPETVQSSFAVVTEHGGDPVRSPDSGRVVSVEVSEGARVAAGAPLMRVLSDRARAQAAELRDARRGLASSGTRAGLTLARQAEEAEAAQAEIDGLERTIAALERMIPVAGRRQAGVLLRLEDTVALHAAGAVSEADLETARLAVDQSTLEVEGLRRDLAGSRAALTAATHRLDVAQAAAEAEQHELEEDAARAGARLTLLQAEGADETGVQTITAPCDGVVADLTVRGSGAWVGMGEVVAQVACMDQPLLVEIALPAANSGRVTAGQPVRLRFDAFPYLRYGIRSGEVRWVAPAAVEGQFTVQVDFEATPFETAGGTWPLRPGMSGSAEIVLARKPAAAWAFEPLARLFEG